MFDKVDYNPILKLELQQKLCVCSNHNNADFYSGRIVQISVTLLYNYMIDILLWYITLFNYNDNT